MIKLSPKSFFILLFLSSFSTIVYSQNMDIKGTVYDSTGISPLPNAIVMAVRMKDSLLLGFTHTNSKGDFSFGGFQIDTFSLIISYPKCEDKNFYIFGHKENYEINISSIKMLPESKEMAEIVIYANKNPIFYRGDTLVYVADSFKVGENAVVEDLLRKLPGIKVDKDGKIKSQGKEVSQVLVDGDEFFGGDATIATKNLAADGVKSVEIYEKKDENGGDETTQVLNLKLKEEAKKGYFGRTSIASDFQNFYQGELLLNKFNGSQKISIFALGSNTPRSGFDWFEENKFGLENERDITFDEDGNASWTSYRTPGIPQTLKAGVYYSDKLGKKKTTKIGFNYTFNDSRVNSISKSRSQYFLSDTTYFSEDSTHNYSLNESHKLNFTLSSQIDSLTTISFSPKLNYSEEKKDNTDFTNFLSEEEKSTRTSKINNTNDSKGYSIDNETSIIRKFKKAKREVSFVYNLTTKVNETNGKLISNNLYSDGISLNDSTDQSKLNQNNSQSHIGRLTYIEPIGKKVTLNFEYMYEYGTIYQNKETRNRINGDYSSIISNYSNKFENIRQQNRFGTFVEYRIKKYTFAGGVKFRNIDILNENLVDDSTIHQNINNVLPRLTFAYNPSQNKRFSIRYTTNSKQPSISDLQPVPDNSNPNRIVRGNATLKPSFNHDVRMNFNYWQALSGRYIYSGLNANLTDNDFVNSTTYDPLVIGKMESHTENADGNIYAHFYGGTGIPFYKQILEISPDVNASYSKRANFINNEKNITESRSIGGSLDFSYTKDSLQFSFSGELSYTSPISSISSVSDNPYTTTTYRGNIVWTIPWKMKVMTDATYTINGQRSSGYNINYLIWNAEINRSFLKTENLILSIIGNDILNQNISANRTVNSNIITDNKTKIISRYFLVKLTLKFNNNKTKEDDANDGW